MLDKGPWVLAFDMFEALPRLFRGLQVLTFTDIPIDLVSVLVLVLVLVYHSDSPHRYYLVG